MPQTVTATLNKKFKSKASNVAVTHNPASPETITINHRLKVCPSEVRVVPRTIIAQGSMVLNAGNTASPAIINADPKLVVRSFNASQVILDGAGLTAGTGSAYGTASPALGLFDVVSEVWVSIDG